jgi:DNA-binding MarR family transcriptional regulator/N-acetylglutamate synthase-like GNAT family acetyltransferase
MPSDTARVAAVRDFNRFYTRVIGVLSEGLVRTPYSLTEARVIFELAQRDRTEVTALRRDLGLDPGYLSRMLGRFESDGLVAREMSTVDARRQVVGLTDQGHKAYKTLDHRSAEDIDRLLDRLDESQQRRLLAAMAEVRDLLDEAPKQQPDDAPALALRAPGPGDLGWVVARNGAIYAEEYGWDATYEALVARIVADFVDHRDPERERGWIAELDGERVGCVFCVKADATTAKLRLLLVEPAARGNGVGGWLVDECLEFARGAGYTAMTLWTNDVLRAARRIYQRAGFTLVGSEPHHSFGHDLVGETWRRTL